MTKETEQEGRRVTFEHALPAHMMAIDGTWRRSCTIKDVSETSATVPYRNVEAWTRIGRHEEDGCCPLAAAGRRPSRSRLWLNRAASGSAVR
ncbi:hypothetical protein JOE52_004900 [Bradyrhizobium canariense]|nr:hypothetical protein [Bradyrhizobium canariense]